MALKKKQKTEFKKLLASLVIGFVAVAFIGSFAINYAAKTRSGRTSNIAVINGEPISVGSDSIFANFYRQFYEEERLGNRDSGITEEKNTDLLRRALDATIQRTLILQYAKKEGIRVSRDTILESIVKTGYYASPDKLFDEERYNSVPEAERQKIFESEEEKLTINLFLDQYFRNTRVSEVEVKSFFQMSDYGKKIEYINLRYDDIPQETLKAFYNDNQNLFERAHVAHLLIKNDEEKAKRLLEEVKADPDKFEEIVKMESEDPTKEKGGDLGWFYRKDMVPEFSEAAFKLTKNEISPVVKTVFGFHILKSLDSVKQESFDNALYRIKREYVEAHREEVEKQVALKSKEILEEALKIPSQFGDVVKKQNLKTDKTDYITLYSQYILNEDKNIPLFELMNNKNLIDNVFSTKVGQVGGPVKSPDGDILFLVLEDKKFDQVEYEKVKEYITEVYSNFKENLMFNDWYLYTLKNSKIVDNFEQFFKVDRKRPMIDMGDF